MRRRGLVLLPVVFAASAMVGVGSVRADLGPALLSLAEVIVTSDRASGQPAALLPVVEKIAIHDGPSFVRSALLDVAERVSVSDAPSFLKSALLNVAERVNVSDAPSFLKSALLNVAEHVNVSDGLHFVPAALLNVNEGVHVSDALADTTPPTVTLQTKPPAQTNSKQASFVFTITDPDNQSGFVSYCKLDTGNFTPCSSPAAYSNLADGGHTFTVHASDPAGNRSQDASYSWTIDTDAPAVTLTSKPPTLTNVAAGSFTFVLTDADGDDPTGLTAACKLDGGAFASCTSPFAFSGRTDGQHTFTVHAADPSGNQSADVSYSWKIDTDPPTVALTTTPPKASNAPTGNIGFAVTDADGDDPTGIIAACKLDGGAFAPCTTPFAYSNLADSGHTFTVHAGDPAGNQSQDLSYSWTIDTDAPAVTLTSKPPTLTNVAAGSFTFVLTDADGDDPTGLTAACKLDGGAFASCASPFAFSGLADGPHTFTVHAADPSGNQSADVSYSWKIDTDPPTVAFTTTPPKASNAPSGNIGFAVTDADGDDPTGIIAACKLDGGAFAPCTTPFAYSNLADGGHTFTVHATDPAGNQSQDLTYTWRIDTDAPHVVITSGPSNPSYVNTATLAFTASDLDGDDAVSSLTVKCSLDGAAASPCTSPKTYQALLPGNHTFTVTVSDPAGNQSSATRTWMVIAKIVFTKAHDGNLDIYSVNPDGSNLTRLTNDPALDASPSWSPDFSRIVFSSTRNGLPQLYVMNADGTNVVRLTSGQFADVTPAWSPDGSRIAFTRLGVGGAHIWLVNADGTGAAPLTSGTGIDATPSWSPDGKRVVFSSFRAGGLQLWIVNADGTGLTQLTTGWGANTTPAWSPDGAWIAFTSTRDGNAQIYKIHPDGSGLTRLTNNHAFDATPAWSPDGSQIVFSSTRSGSLRLFVMSSSDGSGAAAVTADMAIDTGPDW